MPLDSPGPTEIEGPVQAPAAAGPASLLASGSPAPSRPGAVLVSRERVVAPPDRLIRAEDSRLLQALQVHVGAGGEQEQEQLRLVQHLLLGITREQAAALGRREGRASSPLPAPGSPRGSAALAKLPASLPGTARQLAFLRGLCAAMQAAGYQLLTRQEWEAALCENFLFTLPITADYGAMDPALVPPLEQLAPAGTPPPASLPSLPPQLAGRALVWHRGADVVRASAPAWAFKLDCLISFWLLQPLWAVITWLAAQFGVHLRPRPLPGVTSRPFAQPPAARTGQPEAAAPQEPASPKTSAAATKQGGGAVSPTGRTIERRTFTRAFPSGGAVWRQLTQPVQLREACFQDVVLLYRPAGAAAAAAEAAAGHVHRRGRASSGGGSNKGGAAGAEEQQREGLPSVEESVGGTLDEVFLVLKQFRRIPLADLEMVLPAAAVWQGTWGAGLLRTLAVILATRAYQIYVYITNERTAITKHATKLLYERTAASQEAVLHMLAAELAGQRARELLLCYCVLLEAGGHLPVAEVATRCEGLLRRHLGLRHLAVEAGPPLRQLIQWGLVEGRLEDQLAAVPLTDAVGALRQAWRSLAEPERAAERAVHAAPAEPAGVVGTAEHAAPPGTAEEGAAVEAMPAEIATAPLAPPAGLEGPGATAPLEAAAATPAESKAAVPEGAVMRDTAEDEVEERTQAAAVPPQPAGLPIVELQAAAAEPVTAAAGAALPSVGGLAAEPRQAAALPEAGGLASRPGAVTVERVGGEAGEESPRTGKGHSFLGRLLHTS
ncbi:Glycerophosphodiester phosphodiesterase gde1 [Chlorella sorokiniana]|uniref:Glycerophosphodiester phosphodiesterase gde1 n=1 Tax=Chlorella sorokiniana TaxID=3076 RepID=A0A2P6U1M1_CHLSO|nr:Glycerophosphodiester phosphodiesterase gde1 [Chlorella sorokiniana]|eukprot:PRW60212.1 Glycerophosphodiester phosphodiesterase gde1 [Chlorella sorokiniana]